MFFRIRPFKLVSTMKMNTIVFITILFSSILSVQSVLGEYAKPDFSREFKQQSAGISKNAWRTFNKDYKELFNRYYNDDDVSIQEIEDLLERLEKLQQNRGTEYQQQILKEKSILLNDFKRQLNERVVEAKPERVKTTFSQEASSLTKDTTKQLTSLITSALYQMQQYGITFDQALIQVGCADTLYVLLTSLGYKGSDSDLEHIMRDILTMLATDYLMYSADLGPEIVIANIAFALASSTLPKIHNLISKASESIAETLAERSLWSAFKDFCRELDPEFDA